MHIGREIRQILVPVHRLLIASSTRARLEVARSEVGGADPQDGLLVVAPTQRAADDLVRQVPGMGTIGVYRSTLLHMAQQAAEDVMAQGGLAVASHLASVALAHRATARVRRGPGLTHLEPVADYTGFGRALHRTLSRLRAEKITSERLATVTPSGRDLAHLLDEYEKVRQEVRLVDEAALFELARQAGVHPKAQRGLFVDVVPDTEIERLFLAEILERFPHVTALVPTQNTEGCTVWEKLLGIPAASIEPEAEDPLARARRFLFSTERPDPHHPSDDEDAPDLSRAPKGGPPRPLLFSCPGEGAECLQIARHVLSFAAQGIPFDRIAVFLRNPTRTQPLLEDAFDRAAIPYFCTRGTRRPHPTGRAFLSLIQCARERLSAARFAEYLSLDEFPRIEQAHVLMQRPKAWAPPRDERQLVFVSPGQPENRLLESTPESVIHFPLTWEHHLNEAAVIGGQDRWARRLSGYRAELERRLEIVATENESRAEHLKREIGSLAHLEAFAVPIIDRLAHFPEHASWSEWLGHLLDLAGLALAEPEPVASILTELSVLGPIEAVSLDEVERVLQPRLRDLREEPKGARFGHVFVGTLEEARARSFEVVFVPGLSEGLFPRRIFEDPLLLDTAAAEVSSRLVERPQLIREERLLLHGALGAAERFLILSCPRIDALRGRARVPSFYALEVLEAAGVPLADLDILFEGHTRSDPSTSELGWTPPPSPEEAVDDAEYDLATLAPLLRMDADQARGRARYLVVDNQSARRATALVRALEMSWNRGRPLWTEADGLVTAKGPARKQLAEFTLTRKTYSPTALQRYAACPYRFFLGSILRLAPREVPARVDQLDPLTRGSLFHAVQFSAFGALAQKGLWPVTPDNLEAGLTELLAAFEKVTSQWEDDLAPALPGVWRRELEGLRLDLRRWLEGAAKDPAWRPVRAELAFGLDPADHAERDPDSRRKAVRILNRYRIRGAIDWIERHQGTGHLRVTDHKTGRPPKKRPVYVGGGEHLQPILYGLAVQAMMSDPVDEGRLYYCTDRGGYEVVRVPIDEIAEKRIADTLGTINEAVRKGSLFAAPAEGRCSWCDYQAVCGPYAEARASAKRPETHEALQILREAP